MDPNNFFIAPLFVPGDKPDRFSKAASSGTDAVLIDLEDAVAASNKNVARLAILQPDALPPDIRIFVRINAIGTPWHQADIEVVSKLPIAGIILPKSENPADIAALGACLGSRSIIALIESAVGLAKAREIARLPEIAGLAFGSIDFCADLGCSHTRDALLMARTELVLASRLGNCVRALDGVTAAITDPDLAEDDARYASALGFGGKLCIHPSQIEPVLRGFASSPADIQWATTMLAAVADGAAQVDGAMVDAPVRARARQIMARRRV